MVRRKRCHGCGMLPKKGGITKESQGVLQGPAAANPVFVKALMEASKKAKSKKGGILQAMPDSVDSYQLANSTGYNGSFIDQGREPVSRAMMGSGMDVRDSPDFWEECEKQYGKPQAMKMKRMYMRSKAPQRERAPSAEAPLTPKPKAGKGLHKVKRKRGRGADYLDNEFNRQDPVDMSLWRHQKKPKVNFGHSALKMH